MRSLYSEAMSINFEVPTRYSNTDYNRKLPYAQSHVEENKISLYDNEEEEKNEDPVYPYYEEKDHFYKRFHGRTSDHLKCPVVPRRSRSIEMTELRENHDQKFEMTRLPPRWEIESRLQKKPFHNAILKLREIDKKEGPMMKVRLLEKVNQMIKENIGKFWEGIPIDESHLTITQDTKIPLYIYLVLKWKLINLAAHIKFIQEFTTAYVHENNLGWNLALYESAMTIVADKERNTLLNVIDQKEVLKQSIIKNESFVTSIFIDDTDPFVDFTPKDLELNLQYE